MDTFTHPGAANTNRLDPPERDRMLYRHGEWTTAGCSTSSSAKNDFPPKTLTAISAIFHEARLEVMKPGQLYETVDGDPAQKS